MVAAIRFRTQATKDSGRVCRISCKPAPRVVSGTRLCSAITIFRRRSRVRGDQNVAHVPSQVVPGYFPQRSFRLDRASHSRIQGKPPPARRLPLAPVPWRLCTPGRYPPQSLVIGYEARASEPAATDPDRLLGHSVAPCVKSHRALPLANLALQAPERGIGWRKDHKTRQVAMPAGERVGIRSEHPVRELLACF